MATPRRLYWGLLLGLCAPFQAAAQFKPAIPPPSTAQQTEQPQVPLYSAKVNLARLLVSVRDRQGAIITNLNKEDFR